MVKEMRKGESRDRITLEYGLKPSNGNKENSVKREVKRKRLWGRTEGAAEMTVCSKRESLR